MKQNILRFFGLLKDIDWKLKEKIIKRLRREFEEKLL